MNLQQLKELVREVIKEEQDYQELFRTMLDKTGKDINSMSDEEKKKFFNAVDKAYQAKSEGKLTGYANEGVNKFSQEASIDRLKQVKYAFKDDKIIVKKIDELISLINQYS
jgi:rubrerythrin